MLAKLFFFITINSFIYPHDIENHKDTTNINGEESLYYQNASEILDFCLKNFGRNIKLIHDYKLYEFTVIISKTQKA